MDQLMRLAEIVSFLSGFALTGYQGSAADLLVTALAVDACLAPVTTSLAARRGRSAIAWSLIGFVFGLWALIAALLLRTTRVIDHGSPPSGFPPTSDAA
jgi:hypothetical protein